MKLRTREQLTDKIDAEIAWRKKELFDLKYVIENASGRQKVLARCGVALLYAHWEGFVKKSGSYLLEYICMKRLLNKELADNFLALIIGNKMKDDISGKRISNLNWIVEFFMHKLEGQSYVPYKNSIDVESNLSSTVFREIIWCLGLDFTPFEELTVVMDSELLSRRNHIAHGEAQPISADDYLQLHDRVVGMMELFRSQLQNAAVLESYKRT